MGLTCLRRGISSRSAKQIRLGIITGELIHNMVIKKDMDSARVSLMKASKTPSKTYETTLRTIEKRMRLH